MSARRQLRLLRYGLRHIPSLVALSVSMILTIGVDILKPFPLKLLVDNVLGAHSVHGLLAGLPGAGDKHVMLIWVVAGEILVFVAYTVLDMVSSYTATALSTRMTYDLGADLFLHVQHLGLRFHSNRSVGDTIARVTGDTYAASEIVLGALLPCAQAVVALVGMFIVMFNMQPTLTFLALGVMPFLAIVIRTMGRPIHVRTREKRDLEGAMMAVVQRTLSAVPVVKAFGREKIEHARFRSYADRTVRAYLRATFAGLWFKFAAGAVTAVGTALVMFVGGRMALNGTITTGTILVFASYLSSFYDPLNTITHTASSLNASAASADRVMEILEEPIDVVDRPDAQPLERPAPIRYENVTFGYLDGRPAIHDVSFDVEAGQVVAIVGPTGAGKTTLVNMLVRFFDPWEGRITIGDRDIRDYRLASLRRNIAMVLQDPYVFPTTIAENIAYGRGSRLRSTDRNPDATPGEIRAAAEAANAAAFIERLPAGYNTVVGEAGATLSGGEKQRLSIARAFLKDSPILILDEPTSALDARTETQLLEALERLMQGRITFVIAHRLSTIRNADHILVIDRGQLRERGTHDELVAADDLYAELYNQQMRLAEHIAVPAGD